MARKSREIMITADGRDKGKIFVIQEASAVQTEKWGWRATQGAMRSGFNIAGAFSGSHAIGAALMGLTSIGSMPWAELEPLLDEMMSCVFIRPNLNDLNYLRKALDDEIEEVATRLLLRMEVITLHTGFSMDDVRSNWDQMMRAPSEQNTSSTQTSPA